MNETTLTLTSTQEIVLLVVLQEAQAKYTEMVVYMTLHNIDCTVTKAFLLEVCGMLDKLQKGG